MQDNSSDGRVGCPLRGARVASDLLWPLPSHWELDEGAGLLVLTATWHGNVVLALCKLSVPT